MKTITKIIYSASGAFMLACFALSPSAQATDLGGVLPNANTADGSGVLTTVSSGSRDSGFGFDALLHNSKGDDNTAIGNTALNQNQSGSFNTGIGSTALFNNFNGDRNTAIGYATLQNNFGATDNTAIGYQALLNNDATGNTAAGSGALLRNVTGINNTAVGIAALLNNTAGTWNTATGTAALAFNQSTGSLNTADGAAALLLNTGSNNIALGADAGFNLTTGDNNIDIGNEGVAAEGNTIRIGAQGTQMATFIAGIWEQPLVGDTAPVLINSSGQLGTAVGSSLRFKKEIKSMNDTSEAILSLRPVTFHYKTDAKNTTQFGLIAEEVAKVNPALVLRDKEGRPYTVRYDAVNAMLLNEFLKDHRKVQEQQETIAQLKSTVVQQQKRFTKQEEQIEALTSGLQRVSAQLATRKDAPQVVTNR